MWVNKYRKTILSSAANSWCLKISSIFEVAFHHDSNDYIKCNIEIESKEWSSSISGSNNVNHRDHRQELSCEKKKKRIKLCTPHLGF